ncbi:MAG: carboxypeptidase regulatory-like domain-containing protein [Planctomycetes bacterium]|nr:carboxypeptidase regulatory-like domain-containing protein [Planctomycetota bacterium]
MDSRRLPLVWVVLAAAIVAVAAWLLLSDAPGDERAELDVPGEVVRGEAMDLATPTHDGEPRPLELGPGHDAPDAREVASAAMPDALATTEALGALRVRVTFADGRPAPDVRLVLHLGGPGAHDDPTPPARRTDVAGEARFGLLLPGSVAVESDRGGSAVGAVVAGEVLDLALRLAPGRTVRGLVLDAHDAPVSDAELWLSLAGNSVEGDVVARSDASGAFALEAVGQGHMLAAFAPGHAPSERHDLDADVDPDAPVVLRLGDAGARLTGLVRDGDGRPVAGAIVQVGGEGGWVGEGDARGAPPRRTTSDAGGAFAFDGLPPGATDVLARADGFAPLEQRVVLAADDTTRVELVLLPGGVVLGEVHDEDGLPVVGAHVALGTLGGFGRHGAISDGAGRVEIDGVEAGIHIVQVTQPEFVPRTDHVSVDEGETAELQITLVRGGVIEGRVLDAHTRVPVAGAFVAVQGHGARTLDDGTFRLAGLEGDAFTLVVYVARDDGTGAEVARLDELPPDGEPLEILVSPPGAPGEVLGVLRDARDRPLAGVWVRLAGLDPPFPEDGFRSDDEGRFRFAGVPPGAYALDGHLTDAAFPRVARLDVAPGASLDLGVLRPAVGGRLRVRLLADDAALLDVVSLRLSHANGVDWATPTRVGAEAGAESLTAGTWTLSVTGKGLIPQRVEVELRDGRESTLDVALRRGVRQQFVLRWSDGEQVRGCSWRVERGDEVVFESPRLDRMTAEWSPSITLEPGAYRFVLTEDGRELARRAFVVDAQEGPPLVVEL